MSNPLDVLVPDAPAPTGTTAWAAVTGTSPLRVRMDGETTALPITPDIVDSVTPTVGLRVRCSLVDHHLTIEGAAS